MGWCWWGGGGGGSSSKARSHVNSCTCRACTFRSRLREHVHWIKAQIQTVLQFSLKKKRNLQTIQHRTGPRDMEFKLSVL